MALRKVGIEFQIKNKNAFNRGLKSVNKELSRFNTLNSKKIQTLREVNTLEIKMLSNSKREVDMLKRKNREIQKGNNLLKKRNSNSGGLAPGRRGGSALNGGLIGGALGRFLPAAAIGYAGISSFKSGVDRQDQLTQVENMLGRSLTKNDKVSLQGIAKESGQSNSSVISSFYDALSSQFTEQQAKAIALQGNKTATGLNLSGDVATSALLTIMKADPKLDAKTSADLIAGTVTAGRTTGEGVASSVGEFLPTALASGGVVDEALAAFATITLKLGGNVAESSTALKRLFTSIADGSEEAKKLGLSSKLLKEEGLGGVIKSVNKALAESPDAAKALNSIFVEERSRKGFLAFIGEEGQKSFKNSLKLVNKSDSDNNFINANDDASVAMTRFKNNLENISDATITSAGFLNAFVDITGAASDSIKVMTEGALIVGGFLSSLFTEGQIENLKKGFRYLNPVNAIKDIYADKEEVSLIKAGGASVGAERAVEALQNGKITPDEFAEMMGINNVKTPMEEFTESIKDLSGTIIVETEKLKSNKIQEKQFGFSDTNPNFDF